MNPLIDGSRETRILAQIRRLPSIAPGPSRGTAFTVRTPLPEASILDPIFQSPYGVHEHRLAGTLVWVRREQEWSFRGAASQSDLVVLNDTLIVSRGAGFFSGPDTQAVGELQWAIRQTLPSAVSYLSDFSQLKGSTLRGRWEFLKRLQRILPEAEAYAALVPPNLKWIAKGVLLATPEPLKQKIAIIEDLEAALLELLQHRPRSPLPHLEPLSNSQSKALNLIHESLSRWTLDQEAFAQPLPQLPEGSPYADLLEVLQIHQQDVQELIQMHQEDVQENQLTHARLAAALECSVQPLMITRQADGQVLFANEEMARLAGTTRQHLAGHPVPDLYQHPEDRQKMLEQLLTTGRLKNYRILVQDLRGRRFPVRVNTERIEYGGEQALISTYRDVEAEEAQEQKIQEQLETLRLAQEANRFGIFTFDPHTLHTTYTESQRRLLELEVDEDYGEAWCQRLAPEDEEQDRLIREQMKEGHDYPQSTFRLNLPSGKRITVESHARWMQHSGRRILVGITRDITEEQARLEELRKQRSQLMHLDRINGLKLLVRQLAHDLRTPLATISMGVDLLRPQATDPQAVQLIEQATATITEVVDNLRHYVREEASRPEPQWIEVGALFRETLALIEPTLREVRLLPHFPETPLVLPLVKVEIQQVLMNLTNNAADAMSDLPPERQVIEWHTHDAPSEVQLLISDHGPGIPSAWREKIFEPDFTTKPEDQGTGLGLAISRDLVHLHQGTLSVHSRPDGQPGALFRVTLPKQPPPPKSR